MPSVRCTKCFWSGSRKTDAPDGTKLEKGCPNGHDAVVVGGPPPTSVETTPSGMEIAFWDSINIESGREQQRRYLVNGEKLPSVTTLTGILDKPALLDWAARLAREGQDWREVRDSAGDRGTNAHDVALDVVQGKLRRLSDLPTEHRPYAQAAMKWVAERRPEVVLAEKMVASTEHGYAGRFDLLARIDGHRIRLDYKTVTAWHFKRKKGEPTEEKLPPYDENALQLDLYEGAALECGYEAADYGMVVRLGPDGEYEETPFALDPSRGLAILYAYRAKSEAALALRTGIETDTTNVAAVAA